MMLALARTAPKLIPRLTNGRPTIRGLAGVMSTLITESTTIIAPPRPAQPTLTPTQHSSRSVQVLSKERIPVREDHGLYAFFRRKEDADLVGDASYEVVETPEKAQLVTGRSWKASELRLKSFRDLHTLWYVLLRERNLLATQKEETRRMGVTDTGTQVSLEKIHQCRKSMARIKAVINERRLAYEGAVKIAEQQREEHYDKVVLQHQATQFKAERKYLQRRHEYKARKEAERLKRDVQKGMQEATGSAPETVVDVSPAKLVGKGAEEDPSPPLAEARQPDVGSAEETDSGISSTQPKAVNAATVGLFGDDQTSSNRGR